MLVSIVYVVSCRHHVLWFLEDLMWYFLEHITNVDLLKASCAGFLKASFELVSWSHVVVS